MNETELKQFTARQIRLILNHLLSDGSNYTTIMNGIKVRIEMTEQELNFLKAEQNAKQSNN